MTRTILLALALAGCATTPVQTTPEVPRLSCLNAGEIPMAPGWFLYFCTFNGPVPESVPDVPTSLGES